MLESHSLCIKKINGIYGQIQKLFAILNIFFKIQKKVQNDNFLDKNDLMNIVIM